MKLRVKVDGRSYEVEVEAVEPTWLGSAASRVSGSPVGASLPKPPSNGAPTRPVTSAPPAVGAAIATLSSAPPASPASSGEAVVPAPSPAPRPPWHGLTVGDDGVCLAPVPGAVSAVFVKVGDSVRANDPLLEIELSRMFSPQDKPLLGTVRAIAPGVVAEVAVRTGETVAFGQPLVRVHAESGS